ncbi:MAG: HPr family phosphocarrier protein [Kiritimatiellaeota bacterium]|nr:HPr family phosphocarrier protein [Kiritimatiellota bacterium]
MTTEEIKEGNTAQTRAVTIQNRFGIHARPAALFVKTANRFQSDISVEKDGQRVSGKSIIGLMTVEGHQGAVLKLTATGPDAREALDALEDLIQQKFFED